MADDVITIELPDGLELRAGGTVGVRTPRFRLAQGVLLVGPGIGVPTFELDHTGLECSVNIPSGHSHSARVFDVDGTGRLLAIGQGFYRTAVAGHVALPDLQPPPDDVETDFVRIGPDGKLYRAD